jgi:hypothetical protein
MSSGQSILPHQVAGSVRVVPSPFVPGHFSLKVRRLDGKADDLVNGLDGCSAASFYSRAEAQAAADELNTRTNATAFSQAEESTSGTKTPAPAPPTWEVDTEGHSFMVCPTEDPDSGVVIARGIKTAEHAALIAASPRVASSLRELLQYVTFDDEGPLDHDEYKAMFARAEASLAAADSAT